MEIFSSDKKKTPEKNRAINVDFYRLIILVMICENL